MQASVTNKPVLYVYLDTETTMRAPSSWGFSATPFWPKNTLLCASLYFDESEHLQGSYGYPMYHNTYDTTNIYNIFTQITARYPPSAWEWCLIGHNIKFDLHYLLKAGVLSLSSIRTYGIKVWDTALVEYLLSGHRHKYPSLDSCFLKYNNIRSLGRDPLAIVKGSLLNDALADGKTTEDVPIAALMDYCRNDTVMASVIFYGQLKRLADAPELCKIIALHNEYLLYLLEMERTGMHVDEIKLEEYITTFTREKESLTASIATQAGLIINKSGETPDYMDIMGNIGSRHMMSALFYGGTFSITTKHHTGYYKSGDKIGQKKYSNTTKEYTVKPEDSVSRGDPEYPPSKLKDGTYSITSNVIDVFKSQHPLAGLLHSLRQTEKTLNTYLMPIQQRTYGAGILHYSFKQVATATGRLSSEQPNIQNIPDDELVEKSVKAVLVPRADHCFVEIDWKQLEVIGEAFITEDRNLIRDIKTGYDMHEAVCTEVYGSTYTKAQKRAVKGVNFGTIYGGGVDTLAEQSGLSSKDVMKIRTAFFSRYTGIMDWRKDTRNTLSEMWGLQQKLKLHGKSTFNGVDSDYGYVIWPSITGRIYTIDMATKTHHTGIVSEPQYTQMCNYPVQGFATADIVPLCIVYLVKELRKDGHKFNILNTVHDSLLFEVPIDNVKDFLYSLEHLTSNLDKVVSNYYKIDFDLPLNVEISTSTDSWHAMTMYDKHSFKQPTE